MSDYIKFAVFSHHNFFELKVGKKKKKNKAGSEAVELLFLLNR